MDHALGLGGSLNDLIEDTLEERRECKGRVLHTQTHQLGPGGHRRMQDEHNVHNMLSAACRMALNTSTRLETRGDALLVIVSYVTASLSILAVTD